MSGIQRLPSVRSIPSTLVAIGTFTLLWVLLLFGLGGVRSGYLPSPLLHAFDFVFVDILAMTGFKLWMAVHPASFTPNRVSFAITSSIGFTVLAIVIAIWHFVLSRVLIEKQ